MGRLTDSTRTALQTLVSYEEARSGSREVAYVQVARLIHASTSWVRKFCAADTGVSEPRLTLFENIRLAYVNMCVRVELEREVEIRKITALQGELNAVDEGLVGVSTRASTSQGT